MKRKQEDGDSHCKHPKLIAPSLGDQLSDDLVYEICSWIPSRLLLNSCALIDKRWERIVKERCELKLDLTVSEWSDFSLVERTEHNSVTELSVRVNLRHKPAKCGMFALFNNLRSLSLIKFQLKRDFIEYLIKETKIDKFAIDNCMVHIEDLELIALSHRRISLSLGAHNTYGDDESYERIDRLAHLERFIMDKSRPCPIESKYVRLCEHLSKSETLSEVSVHLNNVSMKYIPLMKNLTSLSLISYGSKLDTPSDLSTLVRLRKLSIDACLFGEGQNFILPLLGQLEELGVCNAHRLSNEEKAMIPSLRNIKRLELNRYTSSTFKSFPSGLIRLHLVNSELSEQDVSQIKRLPSLTVLSVANTDISIPPDDSKQVPEYRTFVPVSSLPKDEQESLIKEGMSAQLISVKTRKPSPINRVFSFSDLCDEDEDGTLHCPLKSLTYLNVNVPPHECNIASAISELTELETLIWIHTGFEKEWRPNIEQLSAAKSLTRLDLSSMDDMTDEDTFYLRSMKNLKRLSLGGASFLDHQLVDIAAMENLRVLELSGFVVGRGWEYISTMKNLHTLRARSPFNEDGLEKIALMKSLRTLDLYCHFGESSRIDIFYRMTHLRSLRIDSDLKIGEQMKNCTNLVDTWFVP